MVRHGLGVGDRRMLGHIMMFVGGKLFMAYFMHAAFVVWDVLLHTVTVMAWMMVHRTPLTTLV